jgi:O-antigen/teichoic acid export membrane protein
MGSYEYGIYVFVWTWVIILGGLADLGLGVATIRLVPHYREAGDLALVRGIVLGSRWLSLGVGTLIALVGVAVLYLFDPLDAPIMLPAYLALVCIPLYALTWVQDGIGKAFAWLGLSLVPGYIVRPALLLVAMIAAHAAGLPMEAKRAAAAAIIATWIAGVIQTLLMDARVKEAVGSGTRDYNFPLWLKASDCS